MINRISTNQQDIISSKEEQLIKNVLEKYSLVTTNIYKSRSAYKVCTDKGTFCLKRMKHGIQKAANGNILVEELMKQNFMQVPKYIKTTRGDIYVKSKKMIFYVTEWIDGKECDFGDIEEAKNCIKLLSKFHIASSHMDMKGLKIKNSLKNWPSIFNENIQDLSRYKRIIESKRLKNEFDIAYYQCIEDNIKRGITTLDLLKASEYSNISREALDKKTLCHDSFYYQNVLKKDGEYFLVDLDSIIIDLHVKDLGKMIRRLMFKNEYRWDFSKAQQFIEAYNEDNKLSKAELEIMLALIVFPHKFWKLGRKRYDKHKNWTEFKYMHKLDSLLKYNELQEIFLKDYLNYLTYYV